MKLDQDDKILLVMILIPLLGIAFGIGTLVGSKYATDRCAILFQQEAVDAGVAQYNSTNRAFEWKTAY